ncbi:MAG: UDP-N-acetylmuramate--L-alanine ligase [bacterium]|nr:UDP-N-acetylmuramate--L-alanine ligase [bacterium]
MKYYCIGIKGSGMSTLACILHDLGNNVSGYDDARGYKFTEEGLKERNIEIFYDEHEIDKDTIVTYSKAFSTNHKEIKRVRDLGLTVKDYNQVVGEVTSLFDTISVCGTHGKTTTSLLLSNIINNTIGCNYFVGDGSGYANKKNKIFVIESDEFNKHFLAYYPRTAIVTNIELDHTECYDGLEDIINTFEIFSNKAENVIACGDDKNIRNIKFNNNIIYYGFNEDNDWTVKNVVLNNKGSKFDVYNKNEYFDTYEIPLFGKHMVLNALSAIIASTLYGVDKESIKKYLLSFNGAKRRFKIETINGYTLIDDYAHHPTEISVTIDAARQKYPDKEIIAIFLPNTYSRTEALLDDFIESLSKADKAYIMDIHCDRELQSDYPNASSDKIIEKVRNSEKISIETVDKLLKHKHGVLCFMSCANIYEILNTFKKIIS